MHQEFDPRDLEPAMPEQKPARRRLVPAVIALVALGGFGGVVYYAYRQGQSQQAGGGTPVIRADAGPVKVKPDDPGGLNVPNRDSLLLNNPPGQPGASTVERLLPPPETPLPRPEAPAVVGQLQPPSALPPAPTAPPVPPGSTPAISNPTIAAAPVAPGTSAVVPQHQLAPGAAPPPAGAPRNPVLAQAGSGGTPPSPPATSTPAKPPTQLAAAPPPPPPPPPPAPAAATPAAPPVVATGGSWKIQLASVTGEPAAAEGAWAKIKAAHPELAQLTMTLRHVEVNGKGYNRVQAGGFPDFATADKLCDSLKRKGQDCIVVGK